MTFTSLLKLSALAVPLSLGLVSNSSAVPLIGSIVMGSAGVSMSGSLASFALSAPVSAIAGLSTGDLAAAGTWSGASMTVSASALQASGPVSMTVSAAGFGTFTATAFRVVQQTADSLDVVFNGEFDPLFGAGAFADDQAATLRIEVTRTGAMANLTGTLALATVSTGTGVTPGTGEPTTPGTGTTPGGSTGGGSDGGSSGGGGGATAVPEPVSIALLGAGLAGLGVLRRRGRR